MQTSSHYYSIGRISMKPVEVKTQVKWRGSGEYHWKCLIKKNADDQIVKGIQFRGVALVGDSAIHGKILVHSTSRVTHFLKISDVGFTPRIRDFAIQKSPHKTQVTGVFETASVTTVFTPSV